MATDSKKKTEAANNRTFEQRADAAKKGWETRRRNQQAKASSAGNTAYVG